MPQQAEEANTSRIAPLVVESKGYPREGMDNGPALIKPRLAN